MHEDCVAARPIHLQPLGHAYFTAPLLRQARAVSLFPVVCSWLTSLLLLLFCALLVVQHSSGAAGMKRPLAHVDFQTVCDGEKSECMFLWGWLRLLRGTA